MVTVANKSGLRDRVFAALQHIDIFGVAAVSDTANTPLHKSVTDLLPDARSIVVVGAEVFSEVLRLVEPTKVMGEAAARELYAPHSNFLDGWLNRALYGLARILRDEGYSSLPLPSLGTPVDARFQRGILSFKHAAEAAGLGRIGRNSLLITKKFGPRVRLACLLTNAPLRATPGEVTDPCAGCAGDCINRCPAGALVEPSDGQRYVINKYACASFRAGAGACSTCMSECLRA